MSIFHYTGRNNLPAYCGVEIVEHGKNRVVVLSELATNPGMSVTNAIERIATSLFTGHPDLDVDADRVIWIEHYGRFSYRQQDTMPRDEYTLVRMAWDGERFMEPEWKLVGHTLDEAIEKAMALRPDGRF